jgi:hypothetical protein
MKLAAIRDDDVSFFTNPAQLERVHAPLLEKNIPVNIAAIPFVSANVELRHEKLKGDYEPFIPPEYRGRNERFDIGGNKALVDFVRRHPAIHVAQHGYSHAYVDGAREFDISDGAKISAMISEGGRVIEKAFGVRPAFFVAPWDSISRAAFAALARSFEGISTGWLSKDSVPLAWLPKLLVKKLKHRNYIFAGGTLVLEHPGCILSQFTPVEAIRERVMAYLADHDVAVLTTHHWEYFGEDGAPNEPLLAAYHALVAELSERRDIRFATFPDIRRALFNR